MSIREGIYNSLNIVAVKTITQITPQLGFDYLQNLGFTTLETAKEIGGKIYSDIQQTLALGGLTKGVTNMELNAAYACIANGGTYIEPKLYTKVVDHDGNVILENQPNGTRVMKESTSWLITNAMRDVITGSRGTGGRARLSSGMPVSGKTGTTSNSYDLWFCGYTPYYTASIWFGYDVNKALYTGNTHLNIWKAIMDQVIELKQQEVINFPSCSDITSASVCQKSGLLAIEGICDCDPRGSQVRTEYFAKGTVPTETCNHHVKVAVCEDTGLPVAEYCPNVSEHIYIVREEGNENKTTADSPYQLPTSFKDTTCDIHISPDSIHYVTDFALHGDEGEGPFTVSTSVGEGGTLSISNTTIQRGDSLHFVVIPKEGYIVDQILVNGVEPKEYYDANSYTVGVVRCNLQVTVTFTKKPEITTESPSTTEPDYDTEDSEFSEEDSSN